MNNDHTVDADEAELERIRRLAAAAEPSTAFDTTDHTVDADEETLNQIHDLARRAERGSPSDDDGSFATSRGRPLPTLEALNAIDAPPPPKAAVAVSADRWHPPTRSVRPDREPPPEPDHARPWRLATAALAVLVVAMLVAWLLFGRGDTDTEPTTSTVPAGTAPVGVPITGDIGEGGHGG